MISVLCGTDDISKDMIPHDRAMIYASRMKRTDIISHLHSKYIIAHFLDHGNWGLPALKL